MTPRFIAKPPLAVKRTSLLKHFRQTLVRLAFIVWQIVVPFKSGPEQIDPFPEPSIEVADEQVEQSQWIFDQADERRVHLEQKAQSTFGLMVFLVPLLASLFVFISSRAAPSGGASRILATGLLVLSAVFLLLGFISAVRAISIKGSESLFLAAVIDEAGQFLKYSKASHAYGLLYCAAMNQAMNDHLAQFVKGAHLLTAAAVITLVVAAVPAGLILSNLPSQPSHTKIVGQVDVSSQELRALRDEVTRLKKEIESKVAALEAQLSQLQNVAPTYPDQKSKATPMVGSKKLQRKQNERGRG